MKLLKKSLMAKLIMNTGLLVFMIVFIVSGISFKFAGDAIENQVEIGLNQSLEGLIKGLEEDQSNIEGLLSIVGGLPVVKSLSSGHPSPTQLSEVGNYLASFKESNGTLIETLFIADETGKVFVDSEGGSVVGIDISDRAYFVKVKEGSPVWSDIVLSKLTNQPVRVYIFPVENNQKKTIGYVAAAVKLDKTLARINEVKVGEQGYAYMVDQKGLFIAHPNKDYVMTKNIGELGVPEINSELSKMLAGETGKLKYTFNKVTKLNMYSGFDTYSISINAAEKEYLAPVMKMQRMIIATGIIMLLLGLLASLGISYYILSRINKMKVVMGEASKGDLTVRVDRVDAEGDEIHQISYALNHMLASFNAIVTDIVKTSEVLSSSSQQMAASAEEGGKAASDVTSAVQEISMGMESQATDITKTRMIVNQMKTNLDDYAKETFKMADEAKRVVETAENSQRLVYETVEKMAEIKASSEKTIEVINQLNEQSDKINRISDTIAAIADQTNLLALNAAIEAARAGEAGKGFAVVAEEIRKLATDSQSSANGINILIKEIQSEIKEANNFTKVESEAIMQGVQAIDISGNAFTEILDLLENTQDSIKVVVSGIKNSQDLGEAVNNSVESIAAVMQESSARTQEVSASTEEQTAVSEEIAAASDHLSKMAIDLFDKVSQYKI